MTQTAAQRRFVRLAASINAKAERLGREGRVTAADLASAFIQSDWECRYCGIGIDPLHCSFDHVIPFDNNGPNVPNNIVACCITCQRSKGTKTPEEFKFASALLSHCSECGVVFKPRYSDYKRGYGTTCSRICAGTKGGKTAKVKT